MDAALNRVLANDYLADLGGRSVADLRSLRAECQTVENKLSYLRRLVQGRLDIVTGEQERRKGGGDPGDTADLIERLPELEGEVSSFRRAMFDRIDRIETELTARYRDGSASVDDLLAHNDDSA